MPQTQETLTQETLTQETLTQETLTENRARLLTGHRDGYHSLLPARAGWGGAGFQIATSSAEAVERQQGRGRGGPTHISDIHRNPVYGKMPKRSGIDVAPPDTAFVGISP